ncbi:RNA polymerase sigma factor [Lacipirellula sp.]|uniref:RNA polymerase sigma factor n=1 Tax=Lacipirellula sp. TaxID=2691419 RepID=UPI003D0B6C65
MQRLSSPSECSRSTIEKDQTDREFLGRELLERIHGGDRVAFRELFTLYAPQLLAVCHRILKCASDAEDVVAEVFTELWLRRDRFDSQRGSSRGYLLQLARCRAIDALRARSNRPEVKSRSIDPTSYEKLIASDLDSGVRMLEVESRHQVIQAMASLSDLTRGVLELSYYVGLSHSQIAERLTLPLGTVKTHCRKGLLQLRVAIHDPRRKLAIAAPPVKPSECHP